MHSSSTLLQNWLALYHCAGVGNAKFHQYLKVDPQLNNLPSNLPIDWSGVQRDLNWLATKSNAHVITLRDPLYPQALKHIADPPPVLYVLGDANVLQAQQIAMVGSRACSTNGLRNARMFAQQLAQAGLVITSGLALGIDAASHNGALAHVNGKTVAVLAHGLDTIYPKQHIRLAEQIIQQGCLVSESAIGIIPLPKQFPRRNRLISGLSLGVLIVEAELNSGSLITARYAIEQGRELFAIPGSINLPKSRGCNSLIKQGAKLVENLDDVLEELEALLNYSFRDKYAGVVKNCSGQVALNVNQQQLMQFIDDEATSVDAIIMQTGMASNAVGSMLLELELQGVISAVPGGYARNSD